MSDEMAGNNTTQPLQNILPTGITSLFGDLNSQVDIVFVHGLNGQPARTWKHPDTGFFWPSELKPYLDNARVMLFGYNAGVGPSLDENKTRVIGIARGLLANLANFRRRPQERNRPLIFVGHSLGGLVIKAALIEAYGVLESKIDGWDRIYHSTGGIMLFGVPNAGSNASQRIRVKLLHRAGAINIPPLLEQALRLHSPDTKDLATNFRRLPLCTKELLYIYSYYEERTTLGLSEVVVDETSATIGYNREVLVPSNNDHEGMVKFRDYNDSNFYNVQGQLSHIATEIIERATQAQASSSTSAPPIIPPRPAEQPYAPNFSSTTNQRPFALPAPDPREQMALNQELVAAASTGNLEKVRTLHQAGADSRYSSGPAWQPSALAAAVTAYQSNYDTATNGWYSSGSSAAIGNQMLQTSRKCAEVIKYLCENGADWDSLTPQQKNVARRAMTN